MPRVLIIAHHFPPLGTGGVGRALGWARHLPDLGWEVSVLAASPAPHWPEDESLLLQIPETVTVHRVPSADFRPAQFRGMGKRELSFLWYRPAFRFARSLLAGQRYDVMLATCPPPAALRLAANLGAQFHLPWVADFRDPWTVREPGAWRLWRRRVYTRSARAVTAVNPTLAAHLEASLDREVTSIPNGFEPDEIPTGVERVPRRAVFLGTLPEPEIMAPFFKALARSGGDFLHIGAPCARLGDMAKAEGLNRVEETGYLSRREALTRAATGSVFVTAMAPGLELTLPTKIFDYIGLDGPVLHLGSHRATAEFIAQHHLGESVPLDVAAIGSALDRLWSAPRRLSAEVKRRFERLRQAERTAAILGDVMKGCIP